jgi:pimeloyl-ACP methyl ester carboxylesterase
MGPVADLDHLRLPDGRRLDVRVSGPADGLPLVFHHGTPGARTQWHALERAAAECGIRLITTSRAGYGGSSRLAGRDVVAVVADTEAVLAELGVTRCVVAGWSGGGPHALACAARLGAAAAVLIIAGVGPYGADGLDFLGGMGQENIDEFGAALAGEDTLQNYLGPVREHLRAVTPADIVSSLETLVPDVDKAMLTGEFASDMAASFAEGLRVSADGWVDDDLAFTRPWGFDLAEIRVPVAIWQGSADLMVPFAHGQWLASAVPGATAHLQQGEGHLSILVGAARQMLAELKTTAG